MNWFSIAMKIIFQLPKLMAVAEKAFDGVPDSGAEKKEMVKTTVHTIVSAMLGFSAAGTEATWKQIEGVIDPVIDIACTLLFPRN